MLPDAPARAGRLRWLPVWILAVGLALTALLGAWSHQKESVQRRALLERQAQNFGLALRNQVQSYIDTLPGMRVFGLLKDAPSDAEFRQYVEAISLAGRHPDLTLSFMAELVAVDEREGFVAAVRQDRSVLPAGHADFTIVPPGDRPQYMVIRHGFPFDRATFGYDLFDPAQDYRAAVERAADSGGYVATGPLQFARDRAAPRRPELTAVVVRAALYRGGVTPSTVQARRAALQGVVGIGFHTAAMVQSVLPPALGEAVHLRITDVGARARGQDADLFDSAAPGDPPRAAGQPVLHTQLLDIADRQWQVETRERQSAGLQDATWVLLLFGAGLTSGLALMTRGLVQANLVTEGRLQRGTAALQTERDNLRQSEARYRMLFEHSLDAVLRTRPDGSVQAANPAACALFRGSVAQLQALGRTGLVDTGDPRLVALLDARARCGRAAGQLRMRRADGELFEAEVSSNLYEDSDGQTASSMIVRDVSERQRLAEQQQRLTAIVEAMPDFVGSTDPQGRNIFLNRAARRMLGRGEQEDVAALTIEECHPPWAARIVLEQGLPTALREGLWSGQAAVLGPDGHEIPVSQVILCHRNGAGEVTHFATVARDLTDLRRAEVERSALESRLQVAQRMEAIGTLAGGVAHDFNNVLAAILGNVALARQDLDPAHPARPHLLLIHKAALRARALVRQILTYSRRAPQERSVQPLRPLIEEALALLRATLPSSARLEAALTDAPLCARVDAAQMQQLVLNLCTNAWQALHDETGHIRVGLEPVDLAPSAPRPAGLEPGPYARLSVDDDGQGMDAATRARVFDPFFTTKPFGQGTGLGLAVVHGIVTASGGAIQVESRPGTGTCFEVFLPRVDVTAADAVAGVPASEPTVPGRGEHVLYVDDDEVVGLTARALLERAGFRVTCLLDGQAAVAEVRLAPERFDLVVSDHNMPGLSGLGVAEALRAIDPTLPVVITSGLVTDELRARAQAAGVSEVLLKEDTLERLGSLLHQVLAQHGRA